MSARRPRVSSMPRSSSPFVLSRVPWSLALTGGDIVNNPRPAEVLAQSIREKTARLATYPFLGRASEQDDVRELVVHENYLVSYRVWREAIEILQIWHAAQERGGRP